VNKNMTSIIDYGTDIDSSWSFQDGDIKLTSNTENLRQSISNRLNTIQGALDLFYDDYGSYLLNYLGWRRTEQTLEFVRLEIEQCLNKDPRIYNSFEIEAMYEQEGILINVVVFDNDESLELNYVLTDEGIEEV